MSILITNTELQSVEQLPENMQTLLMLIPQGMQWVTTMMDDELNQVSFPSSEAFIEQLNIGLRDTSLVYFDNIDMTVDVKKLLEISANDLRDMLHFVKPNHVEQGGSQQDSPQQVKMASLLMKYGLIRNSAFSKITQFLQQQHSTNLFCCWSSTFADNLIFYNILTYCEAKFDLGANVQEQALYWASSKAQTLAELAHYYCFYLTWVKDTDGRGLDIDEVFNQLSPLVLDNLDCPTVTFELDTKTLHDAITQWNKAGKTIGFTSFSTGLLDLALNIDLQQKTQIKEQAIQYIEQLQKQLNTHLATGSFIDQAGQYRHYLFELAGKTIMLNVNDIGCLSFYGDRFAA